MRLQDSHAVGGAPRTLAPARGEGQPRPVLYLAVVGALLIAFEIYVLGRWVTGPNFTATPTGAEGSSVLLGGR